MSVWANPITIGFGIACAAVIGLTVATRKRAPDAVWMAVILLGLWFLSKVSILAVGYMQTVEMAPFTNAFAVIVCMALWVRKAEAWKLGLALLLETRAFIHVFFWTVHHPTDAQMFNYILTLNVLFALELACVASPGGQVIANLVGSRLSGYSGGRRHGLRAFGKGGQA